MNRFALALAPFLALLATPAAWAEQVSFGPSLDAAGWETVNFALLSRAKFAAIGSNALSVSTDGNGALIWKPLPEALRASNAASWTWSATEAVPATDLTKKGQDDRVLSVYFLFGTPEDVGKSATRLLRSDTSRALVYTFGGNVKRGTVLPSPHMGARGKFIVLRGVEAANGTALRESVDIFKDSRRVFGADPGILLGIAVSSDSDDTGSKNVARLSDLTIGTR